MKTASMSNSMEKWVFLLRRQAGSGGGDSTDRRVPIVDQGGSIIVVLQNTLRLYGCLAVFFHDAAALGQCSVRQRGG